MTCSSIARMMPVLRADAISGGGTPFLPSPRGGRDSGPRRGGAPAGEGGGEKYGPGGAGNFWRQKRKKFVSNLLTIVTGMVTISPHRTRPGCMPGCGARAVLARGFATRSRAALGISPVALRLRCEVRRWTQGQAGVGNAHSTDRPRPRKHGL